MLRQVAAHDGRRSEIREESPARRTVEAPAEEAAVPPPRDPVLGSIPAARRPRVRDANRELQSCRGEISLIACEVRLPKRAQRLGLVKFHSKRLPSLFVPLARRHHSPKELVRVAEVRPRSYATIVGAVRIQSIAQQVTGDVTNAAAFAETTPVIDVQV